MRKTKKKRKKNIKPQSLGGKMWKILGSPKLSLVLAIFALSSIVYFQDKTKKNKKKKIHSFQKSQRHKPIISLKKTLGRSRKNGPYLTPQFFNTGDIIIRQNKKLLQLALIWKTKKNVQVVGLNKKQPLIKWLKETNGRFALYRIKKQSIPNATKWLSQFNALNTIKPISQRPSMSKKPTSKKMKPRPTSQPLNKQPQILKFISQLYQKWGTQLPKNKKYSQQKWLQLLTQKSHYNDLKTLNK